MSYFKKFSDQFEYKIAEHPNQGLRPGQVGALHAVISHFITKSDPAIVSLPTGYGKTALMEGLCFVNSVSKALIVVPTDALRKQTVKAFQSLDTLRRLNALPPQDVVPSPKVVSAKSRVTYEQGWLELTENADVVVVTPGTASPEVEGVVAPPSELFDLVIVDEGHHSPARTWKALIEHTPKARHVLLSATPFRRDKLQLPGKLVFFYPLKMAVQERAFGRVKFVPVELDEEVLRAQVDDALVAKAVEVFSRDKNAVFDHRLLIRTDKITSAELLARKYQDAGLSVTAVSSRLGKASIARIEGRLESGGLDGIVCVDMFGEGYDFPKFKIAVLHVAHRSLVPTLQFIGRFARTNDESTGDATFIAFPSNVNSESNELYRSGVEWEVLLADIADAQQLLSIKDKETLDSFEETAKPTADYESVDPGNIRLPRHLSCYSVDAAPDFNRIISQVRSLQVTNIWVGDDQRTCILLMNDVNLSPWVFGGDVWDSLHECVLMRYYADSDFLFVTSTRKSSLIYNELLDHFVDGAVRPLTYAKVRRVLNGLSGQEFFSVGVRNNSPVPTTESYRIVAGSQADRGIRDSDASSFSQGHFFGRGEVEGSQEIIGASAGGRVWSNGKFSIPNILKWMDELYDRIASTEENIGPSGLDRLTFGEHLDAIPLDTITADWSQNTYRKVPKARWRGEGTVTSSLLDFEICDIEVAEDGSSLAFSIRDDFNSLNLVYTLAQLPHWRAMSDPGIEVEDRGRWIPVDEWLGDYPLSFFTANFSSFVHGMLTRRHSGGKLSKESLIVINWQGCERVVEFDTDHPERLTVQRYLQNKLLEEQPGFLIYDHRSGEAADFITGHFDDVGTVIVRLYHCKGAGSEKTSARRVDDVYELAGQAVKSVRFQRKDQLIGHIQRRTKKVLGRGCSPFLIGDRDEALHRLRAVQPIDIRLEVFAVQPGISCKQLEEDEKGQNVREVMAAANDNVAMQQSNLFWIIDS